MCLTGFSSFLCLQFIELFVGLWFSSNSLNLQPLFLQTFFSVLMPVFWDSNYVYVRLLTDILILCSFYFSILFFPLYFILGSFSCYVSSPLFLLQCLIYCNPT